MNTEAVTIGATADSTATGDRLELPITIFPELETLLPPLSTDEEAKLRQSIESEGIRDNLLVWRTTRDSRECRILVDGHNRYRITESLGRSLSSLPVADIDFTNMDEAKAWIIANQLMRRNLTDEQRAYFRGAAYDATKRVQGGTGANQHTEQMGKNCPSANTAEKLGEQFGVSARTIKNNAAFKKAVDALPPEEKAAVLAGQKKLPKASTARKTTESVPEKTIKPEKTVNPSATSEVTHSDSFDTLRNFPLTTAEDAMNLIRTAIDRVGEQFASSKSISATKGKKLGARIKNLHKRLDSLWEEISALVEPAAPCPEKSVQESNPAEEPAAPQPEAEEEIPTFGNLVDGHPVLTLRVVEGPNFGQATRLADGVLIIGNGSDPLASFKLTGRGVSPFHAILRNSRRDKSGPVLHVYEANSGLATEGKQPLSIVDIDEDGFTIGENRITVGFSGAINTADEANF